MQWISKEQPIYVWKDDTWYNERNAKIYSVDIENQYWFNDEDKVFFTKKTKIMK